MKKIVVLSALFALAAVSAQAQGTVNFSNSSTTKISTNLVAGGPAIAYTVPVSAGLIYRYALFCSATATSVNGQTAAFYGGASTNYAFNDSHWTLVAYGSNFLQSGEFISASANGSGATAVSGVAGGSSAQFVVIGWSGGIGANITALQNWFNGGSPAFNGWIGQSVVSGAITLGTGTPATLFGTSAPDIQGFNLGLVVPPAPVAPVITSQPANATAPVGASASFSVSAYGTPSPACQWMFNSTNVIAGATSYTLTLNNVQYTNAGTYSLFITNTAGSTNSYAASLTVTAPSGTGYVYFENSSPAATKIYTNSSVGGPDTGLTVAGGWLYYYALYASATATSVLGQTAAIDGSDSSDYAFNDSNWTLVAYGTNSFRGGIISADGAYAGSPTPVSGIAPGTTAQFVVIGWSANVGTSITDVEIWFNDGSPASNGWIGQSAVSGAITLGNGSSIRVPLLFSTNAPYLPGFTLGLGSPVPGAAYAVPAAPPAIMQTVVTGQGVQLSWPPASGSFEVLSAPSPGGPWSDTTLTNGVIVPIASQSTYYKLVAQ